MSFDRVMWACAALFVIFGLALLVTEDDVSQNLAIGLSTLCLGCFGLAMAGGGVAKGQIRFQTAVIQRRTQPRAFWAAIVLVSAAGGGTIVAALWALFVRPW
ncbi:MAG: hypothetical protein GY791_04740 [Alphaproteobacteria bacterium]|nr:hypothetical protein [Alphaproteobacteria bacterium]